MCRGRVLKEIGKKGFWFAPEIPSAQVSHLSGDKRLTEAGRQVTWYRERYDAIQAQKEQLEIQVAESQSNFDRQVQEYEIRNASLQRELATLTNVREEAEQRIKAEWQQKQAELKENIKQLESANKELKKRHERDVKGLKDTHADTMKILRTKLETAETERTAWKERALKKKSKRIEEGEEHERQLQDLQQALNDLRARHESSLASHATLQTQVEHDQAELANMKLRYRAMEVDLTEMKVKLRDKEDQIKGLEQKVRSKDERIEQGEKEVRRLEEKLKGGVEDRCVLLPVFAFVAVPVLLGWGRGRLWM
ncbi:hypothetical protein HK097_001573 [Rhizophlyctis rosea]|uniref:Uncharacterized protein n=1 Tax=Rhizophlyctis rosea TaxID=64517 RepID=A0AAD5X0Q4_9FUNG|nr:hypothetical protein HK097_001573 [Rhizophlyctis rosea]